MLRPLIYTCVGALTILSAAHYLAQKDQNVRGPAPSPDSQFAVSTAGDSAFLLDRTSGSTWMLRLGEAGKPGWLPLEKIAGSGPTRPFAPLVQVDRSRLAPVPSNGSITPLLEGLGYKRIRLRRTIARYLMTAARINGKEVNLLVDTGAPSSHLDPKRTKTLGLKWEKYEGGYGKAGTDGQSLSTIIDFIEVGSFRTQRVKVAAYDITEHNRMTADYADPPADGLIGADVLGVSRAVIDYGSYDIFFPEDRSGVTSRAQANQHHR